MGFLADRHDINTAFVLLGALIGAGFASGQELTRFFAVFGNCGLVGAAGAGIALGFVARSILKRASVRGELGYRQLLRGLPRPLARLALPATALFLFAGLAVMLSAGGSALADQLRVPRVGGTCLLTLAVLGACWYRTQGFVRINTVLVPVLLILLVMISVGTLLKATGSGMATLPPPPNGIGWWGAALLYVGYNSIAVVAVLPPLARPGLAGVRGAVVGGFIFSGLAVFCIACLQAAGLPPVDLPMLAAAKALGGLSGWVYAASFQLAVFTTAVANLFALAQECRSYRTALIIISALALPVALFPFSVLVACLYPAFGYIGLALLLTLLVSGKNH